MSIEHVYCEYPTNWTCSEECSRVVISNAITEIGSNTFKSCAKLHAVEFMADSQIETIGVGAFYNCDLREPIILPRSLRTISNSAFEYCKFANQSLELPFSVETIGERAFAQSQKFNLSFESGSMLTSINKSAFYYSYIQSIDFANTKNLVSIGETAFESCHLKSVCLPESLTTFGPNLFYQSYKIKHADFSFLTRISALPTGILYYCSYLTSVDLPCTLASLESYVFYSCSRIQMINMSHIANLASIGDRAFDGCDQLEFIYFPPNLTHIGAYGFNRCTKLPRLDLSDLSNFEAELSEYLFLRCTSMQELILPSTLTTINLRAVFLCSSLASVRFASSPKPISYGSHCFGQCPLLTYFECHFDSVFDTNAFAYSPAVSVVKFYGDHVEPCPAVTTFLDRTAFSQMEFFIVPCEFNYNTVHVKLLHYSFDGECVWTLKYPMSRFGFFFMGIFSIFYHHY